MGQSKVGKWVAAAITAVAMSSPAWGQYSKVVMFGDSMTDTHRWYDFLKATTGRGAPDLPSMPGRFSDGLVSSEVLANMLGVPLQNYSFSGATTGYRSLVLAPMGILTQVNEYVNDNTVVPTIVTVPLLSDVLRLLTGPGKADPKALHLIWGGPDDYYFLGGFNALTAYSATANIQQAITSLYRAGARYFFVPTMPDLSITPSARYNHEPVEPGYMARATKYSKQFHDVLTKGLETMRQRYPQAKIMSFDTIAFTDEQLILLAADGFNITDSCQAINLVGPKAPPCTTPEKYLFWDSNHLTAVANKRLAEAWYKAIDVQP